MNLNKQIAWLLAAIVVLLLWTSTFASGVETVKDNNDGYLGDILVNTGVQNGQSDVGHWTDLSDIPGLKGDKGDTGTSGYSPIKGVDYFDGLNGVDGKDGYAPVNGVDYFNGVNGINGKDGTNGNDGKNGITPIKGIDYTDGSNGKDGINGIGKDGENGITPVKGVDYFDGLDGVNGKNGKDVDPKTVNNLNNRIDNTNQRIDSLSNRVSKLERTQFKLQVEFRIFDSKRLTISPYISQNFTRNKIDEVGVRVTVKLGKSYEEKLIEKTNSRLSAIEKQMGRTPVIEKTVDSNGKTTSIHIIENGLVIDGTF
jgi:hypothetical protein